MANCNTINTCGEEGFSQCVRYEKELPDFSKIAKSCVNLEDTTSDLYELIGEIKEQIPEDLTDKIELIEELIDEIKIAQNICNYDITGCVDTSDLTDPCGERITTLGQLLNYLKDK